MYEEKSRIDQLDSLSTYEKIFSLTYLIDSSAQRKEEKEGERETEILS